MQRAIPNAALGRVGAVFLTAQAAATLAGATAGPFLAQAVHLTGVAAEADGAPPRDDRIAATRSNDCAIALPGS